jgi:hypothetical protein
LELKALAVNGKRVAEEKFETVRTSEKYSGFSYHGVPEEGIELSLEARSSDSIDLKIEEWSYGLPEIAGRPNSGRPDYIIALPFLYSDCTVITKTVTF